MALQEEIQKLITKLTEDNASVSSIITKAKTINNKINNKKLATFIEGELNEKYTDEDFPEYRLVWGESTFEFRNSYTGATDIRQIPMPEGKHMNGKSTNYRPIINSVPELEEIIKKNKGSSIKIQFTPGQMEVSKQYFKTLNNWELNRAWWSHSPIAFTGMLFNIKQQLLNILLEIEELMTVNDYEEKIFTEKTQFDATYELIQIIEKAKKNIVVIDGYVDGNTLKLLSSKKENVTVRILTDPKAKSEALYVLIDTFNKQYKKLEVKYSSSFHDRFMIIDDVNYYQVGASIKDLGNKTFTFLKLKETFITDSLNKKFNDEWNKK